MNNDTRQADIVSEKYRKVSDIQRTNIADDLFARVMLGCAVGIFAAVFFILIDLMRRGV